MLPLDSPFTVTNRSGAVRLGLVSFQSFANLHRSVNRSPHCTRTRSAQPAANPWRKLQLVAAVSSRTAESLPAYPVAINSYDEEDPFEPSNDLRELASAQLQSLFQVLRRVSPGSYGHCRACVYARRADSLDAPQMKLQRVACYKSTQHHSPSASAFVNSSTSSSSNASFEELDEVLTLHKAAWEPGSAGSSNCETESLLINEEIVLLPSSNLLVLPLSEAGILVGLLVVEVLNQPGSPVPYQPQPLRGQQQQQQQTVWELPPVLGLSEDVLWALRTSVPPLAKACAMDLRTALTGAQQEARQRLARSLLLEARGPLKVLGTFGDMLVPRLRTGQSGEPESDMANGMLLQGQRLADVVAQLEAALRPAAATTVQQSMMLQGGNSTAADVQWQVLNQQQQLQPWREPLALPSTVKDDGDVSEDDDSWACADAAQQPLLQKPASSSRGADVTDDMVLQQDTCTGVGEQQAVLVPDAVPTKQQQQQPQQQVVELIPGKRIAESLEISSRDIRWKTVDAPVVPNAITSSSSSSTVRFAAGNATFDASRTIDLEPEHATITTAPSPAADKALAGASSSNGSSSSGGSQTEAIVSQQPQLEPVKPQFQKQQLEKRPAHRGLCNVIEVLSHLLSAVASLAQVQGINLIVNDPLHVDPPHTTSNSSSQGSSAATAPTGLSSSTGPSTATSSSSSTALVLLPRPVRPLLAGVSGSVARRVLAYCLDVALQCTPKAGQLCVTARSSSGGVEVSLMHTGQAQPSRLHTSTAYLDAAALGTAAPAPEVLDSSRQRVLSNKRKRYKATGASRSSSSTWSAGLQELSSSTGLRGGSSLITLDFARQVLQTVGGRLTLTYPYHFINAVSGQLEVGSNIEVWLPSPSAAEAL